ncbi:Peroxidase, family 2-domain-containing protein [Calycina marina]|uniref:Peroxidase, family 2-domain-containing protein n=1 Tax=Calycina marina TaxID=1763456 RepID=A0A9P7Z181_9HELO|nr:Peroxidase, family 2-domain-containing protein [Calycina marina]
MRSSLIITSALVATSSARALIPGIVDLLAYAHSPCLGLDSLTNHGFIHHNGRNMTIPHLLEGLAAGMNIDADFTIVIGGVGLLSSPNPLGDSFDLHDLNQHNSLIEHDASLSREDATTTSISQAAKAIANHTDDSEERKPYDTAGVANVENVRGLFEKERLSCDLGWRPRAEPITLNSLGLKALELFNANPQAVPEGATITK